MNSLSTKRILITATWVILLDQVTKGLVRNFLPFAEEKVVVPGFFKLVHWGNTGAAWSLFYGNNEILAIISLAALLVLFLNRRHFDTGSFPGQFALGLIFGGIVGNLVDRLWTHHVTDFIYFFLQQRGGGEKGFPAFNIADTAICTGVGLLFLLSFRNEANSQPAGAESV
jgi:signal peptidase II